MEFSQFISVVQLVSSCIVTASGALAIVGAFFRPVRDWVKGLFTRKKEYAALIQALTEMKDTLGCVMEEHKLMKNAYMCLTRNALTDIWHRAEDQGYIGDWDRMNFEEMNKAYTALGGNSYIHEAYAQILRLPSKPKATRKPRKTTKKTKR